VDVGARWSIESERSKPSTARWTYTNRFAIARLVAEIFFPQRPELGLDQRNCSAAVVDKIVSANAEHKSAAKAQRMLRKLAEIQVSVANLMDLSGMIGEELHDHLQQQAIAHANQKLQPQYAETPGLVTVSVDGGRIMTRADAGRGVHEQAWKETKHACLLTMSSSISQEDPHPQLPACFANQTYVEKLVREMHASTRGQTPKDSEKSPIPENLDEEPEAIAGPATRAESCPSATRKKENWRPQRLVRTCLSSMACSDQFGPLVAGVPRRWPGLELDAARTPFPRLRGDHRFRPSAGIRLRRRQDFGSCRSVAGVPASQRGLLAGARRGLPG